ncbi:hypothetical protein P280DRAFT_473262 [Massarina eburnea CBS 473.64]|uniref:Uncharacterized protein n=1 Tax=Massarina eburnea CBS 473.64 TaxID=1395130 RepID=A0A6A6RLE3_9PLEO|nr:hypothetical protein P280DRAFT_473262 [Massarina eburnea CBS 473.64]
MAPTIEDRYLWLGLGVFTFVAVKAVAHGLRHIVTLTEVHNPLPVPPPQPPADSSPRRKEDSIKTSSLITLATCTNIEIRRAATQILCERFQAHPSAWRLLLRDLKSQDPETLRSAHLAINLLAENGTLKSVGGKKLRDYPRWLANGGAAGVRVRSGGLRDPEERELRRRRREAMIINEGDRPVSQEDVYMRDGEGRISWEEEFNNAPSM